MTLIIGIPNAGKTTYSQRYEKVVHYDDVRGRGRRDRVVDAVKADNDICVEGVYEKAIHRAELVKASTSKNVCIWLDTPLETCVNREINGRHRSEHMVIWASEDFEPPTFDEGWDEILIVREGENVECYRR